MPSSSDDPRREPGGTYLVPDRDNLDELKRVQLQDQLVTTAMGGVLPEQPDPGRFQYILDVGCGTGGWLIELARTIPSATRLVGVDVNRHLLNHARGQAQEQQVSQRVEFRLMDALQMLEFPAESFDLVNHRFGLSWLRTWDWPRILAQYERVCRVGGVVRITEAELPTQSNSSALNRLMELAVAMLHRAGHFFTPTPDGIINHLAELLQRCDFEQVQTHISVLHHRGGTPGGQSFAEDMRLMFRTLAPALRKWGRMPEDYEATYQQMLHEMQQPEFEVSWRLLTVWGTRVSEIEPVSRSEG
jgi:ubiquinone/menaquinone biosynthesis C-methylase UbiE